MLFNLSTPKSASEIMFTITSRIRRGEIWIMFAASLVGQWRWFQVAALDKEC